MTDEQRQAEADEADIQDALGRHGGEMMEPSVSNGCRMAPGATRISSTYMTRSSQGLAWAYALIVKS